SGIGEATDLASGDVRHLLSRALDDVVTRPADRPTTTASDAAPSTTVDADAVSDQLVVVPVEADVVLVNPEPIAPTKNGTVEAPRTPEPQAARADSSSVAHDNAAPVAHTEDSPPITHAHAWPVAHDTTEPPHPYPLLHADVEERALPPE